MGDEEPRIREQLVEARERITAQIDEMNVRASTSGRGPRFQPPDYRGLIAELQQELHEIDALLNGTESPED